MSTPGEPDQLYAVTVSNHPYSSGYSIVRLHYDQCITENEPIDYSIGKHIHIQVDTILLNILY